MRWLHRFPNLAVSLVGIFAPAVLLADNAVPLKLPAGPGAPRLIPVRRFVGHSGGIEAVAITSDGRIAASGGSDFTARLWDTSTGTTLHVLTGHTSHIIQVDFSADGKRLMTGSVDTTSRVWDVASGELVAILQGHSSHVHTQAISADGTTAVTGSCDTTLRVWDVGSEKERLIIQHGIQPRGVALSPDGTLLVCVGHKEFTVYETKTGTQVYKATLGEDLLSVRFTDDGKAFYVSCFGGPSMMRMFDARTYAEIQSVAYRAPAGDLVLTSDRKLAACANGGAAIVWDTQSGKEVRTVGAGWPGVHSVAMTPDGRYIVAGCGGEGDPFEREPGRPWVERGVNLVTFCDLKSELPVATSIPMPHEARILSAVISPDGSQLFLGLFQENARQIDLLSGKVIREFPDLSLIHYVSYSRDSRRIAVARKGGITILDAASGAVLNTWDANGVRVTALALRGEDSLIVGTMTPPPASQRSGYSAAARAEASRIIMVDLKSRKESKVLSPRGVNPFRFLIGPDDAWMLVWDHDQSTDAEPAFPVYDLKTGALLRTLRPQGRSPVDVSLMRDGRLMLLNDGELVVCDSVTSAVVGKLSARVNSVALSSDGSALLTIDPAGLPSLWDASTLKLKRMGRENFLTVGNNRLQLFLLPDGQGRLLGLGGDESKVYKIQFAK